MTGRSTMSYRTIPYIVLTLALLGIAWIAWEYTPNPFEGDWTPTERALIASLSLSALPDLPASPDNAVADDPDAIRMGHQLFFDNRLSANQTISCATCHQPERFFTDGLPLAQGLGQVQRHTMGLLGVAWSPWLFWDGRKDSLWSQALEPLENPLEHGSDRMTLVRLIASDATYRASYQALFGALPDIHDTGRFPELATPVGSDDQQRLWESMTESDRNQINQAFANIGKLLAAYQRQLKPLRSNFDDYADTLTASSPPSTEQTHQLTRSERAGLRLFIGKAQCINCHNGPLFTNNEFHNTGIFPAPGQLPERGRWLGARLAVADVFNCLGPFSSAPESACQELRFIQTDDQTRGAQRTPSLRHVADTAPYMHAGQLASLEEVVRHYNAAQPSMLGHSEAEPLRLRRIEQRQLVAFLKTLSAEPPTGNEARWWQAATDTP